MERATFQNTFLLVQVRQPGELFRGSTSAVRAALANLQLARLMTSAATGSSERLPWRTMSLRLHVRLKATTAASGAVLISRIHNIHGL